MPQSLLSLPKLLGRNGYATACVGKWHLGFQTKQTDWNQPLKPGPLEVGFDYYFGVPFVNSHAPYVYVEGHHVVGLDPDDPFVLRANIEALPPSPIQKYPEKDVTGRWSGAKEAHKLYRDEMVGTTLTEKAIDWMQAQVREKNDQPFFLYFATTNIHHPFTPHPRFQGTSQCGRYGDFIHELDWIVGEVTAALDAMDIADNTLVILTSDNGGMFNEGGRDAWQAGHYMNGQLLGWKFGAWEGGHRVPLIARWPGHIEAGSDSSQLISSIDLLATFAALLGDELTDDEGVDSFNQLPAFLGDPTVPIRDHLISAPFHEENLAIRRGQWLFIGAQGSGGFGEPRSGGLAGGPAALGVAMRTNSDVTRNGKLKENSPKQQLYNLSVDLPQRHNVIRKHPEIAAQLAELLQRSRRQSRTAPRR